jgi:hypothetical protein
MSFEEKSTWIYAVIALIVPVIYIGFIFGQLQGTPVTEIAYEWPMLTAIGIGIPLAIVAHILVAIAVPKEADKRDERDKEINRLGDYFGSFALYGGGLLALGLALAGVEHFWIANAIFFTFIVNALMTTGAKFVAYRGGI